MKSHLFTFSIVIYIFISLYMLSCSRSSGSRWESYGQEADNIIALLDSLYGCSSLSVADTASIERLERAVKGRTQKNGEALTDYWRAQAYSVTSPFKAISYLKRARQYCDSTLDPYLNSRIRLCEISLLDVPGQTGYITLRSLLEYYRSIRDTTMIRACYSKLGTFYLGIQDLENYHECTRKIERLYLQSGDSASAVKIRSNFALYHILKGDSAAAAGIISGLIGNRYVKKDSIFMGHLYVNIASLFHEPDSMLRAIEISPEFRGDSAKLMSLEFGIAQLYDKRGDTPRCDSILNRLAPYIERYGDDEAKKKLYSIVSVRKKNAGDLKGALEALEKSRDYAEKIAKEQQASGIKNYIYRDNVARIDSRYEQEKNTSRIRWISIVMVVVILCGAILFLLLSRHRRTQLARAKAERDLARTTLRLEREQRSKMAMGLIMTEHDNIVKNVSDAIDDMDRKGRISAEDKRNVSCMIRTSQAISRELDDFRVNYEKVHPEFIKRLTENYPGLSEGDIRLALYISAGLGTKQIAHLLRIRPDSVKKNRQRMRRHMGLPASASLEETLRNFTS